MDTNLPSQYSNYTDLFLLIKQRTTSFIHFTNKDSELKPPSPSIKLLAMASNTEPEKDTTPPPATTTTTNADGLEEVTVNTVDHRSPAGDNQPATTEKVQIIHDMEATPGHRKSSSEGTTKGFMAGAVQSVKDAISGDKTKK